MSPHQLRKIAWLTILFGIVLWIGVGVLSRPNVATRPVRGTEASRDPASIDHTPDLTRPYDIAGFVGLTIVGVGVVLLIFSRRSEHAIGAT